LYNCGNWTCITVKTEHNLFNYGNCTWLPTMVTCITIVNEHGILNNINTDFHLTCNLQHS